MRHLIQQISRQHLAFFLCCVLMTALIYSKFTLSVSMFALLFLGFLSWDWEAAFPLRLNPALKANFRRFIRYKPYWMLSLFFFIVFLSGFYSEDSQYWAERLRLKIPFILAPFAFASIPPFSRRQYYGLFYFLLILLFFSGTLVLFNYWQHYDEINQMIWTGQAMPTPMSHIRYSLLMALSIIGGVVLYFRKFYWKKTWERGLILALTIALFGIIHILSVRSGLVALYTTLIILGASYIWYSKKWWLGIVGLVALVSLPVISYQLMPSFRAKARYAYFDLERYLLGNGKNYSDAERWLSLEIGLEIGRKEPLLGIGAGDLKSEMYAIYADRYPDFQPKMPHNQLISVFAGTGWLGLTAFLFAFFYPLLYRRNYREPLFFALHLIIFLSFWMENTLETSIGIALYLMLLLMALNHLSQTPLSTATKPPTN